MSAVDTTHAAVVPALPRVRREGLYLLAFAAAAAGAGTGRAVTTTYLPVLLDRIESSPGLIGLVMLVNAGAGLSVPLVVGYWSDRRRMRGAGGRLPFVLGGSLVAAGGLVAVALGASSSYLALAAFGATVYVGLNAITTAHRALVAELFVPEGRARATSAQEIALLSGSMLGLVAGGLLTEVALWAPFVAAAALVPLLALPTLARVTEPETAARAVEHSHPLRFYRAAAARPDVRALLLAEILWVLAYAALPTFFVLYAERVLDLETAVAAVGLAAFGLVTAAFTLVAGRIRNPEQLGPALFLGVALMGSGLLAVSLTTDLALVAPALIAAAAGFGIVSTTGFPVLASIIPPGEAGGYTALFFSVRAIASAVALPTAGGLIALTESYRAVFVLGGAAALFALVPLTRFVTRRPRRLRAPSRRWLVAWAGSLAVLYAGVLTTGLVVAATGLHEIDEASFRAVNALGPGPEPLFELLEEPIRNYLLLIAVPIGAALLAGPRRLPGVLALEVAAGALAVSLLEAVYALYDRPRPSEVFDNADVVLAYGHDWARIEAFPSGHMAVITALAAAAWFTFPRLRYPLIAYVALNAVTRVLFGAHFPLDVIAGIALGYGSAVAVRALLTQTGVVTLKRAEESAAPC
jgi:membrane-associated phospholipid phosphatase/predicted MFS family arabinose efflux permease